MDFFQEIVRLLLSPSKKNIKGATNRHPTSTIKYIQGGSLAITDEMLSHLRYIYEANSITCNPCEDG